MASKAQVFSDILTLNITPEMRARLNKLNADRCSGYAPTAVLVRNLLDASLTYYGYPPQQVQPQPQPQQLQPAPPPFPSPFQQVPMNGGPRANP